MPYWLTAEEFYKMLTINSQWQTHTIIRSFSGDNSEEEPAHNAGDTGDIGSIPRSGRFRRKIIANHPVFLPGASFMDSELPSIG